MQATLHPCTGTQGASDVAWPEGVPASTPVLTTGGWQALGTVSSGTVLHAACGHTAELVAAVSVPAPVWAVSLGGLLAPGQRVWLAPPHALAVVGTTHVLVRAGDLGVPHAAPQKASNWVLPVLDRAAAILCPGIVLDAFRATDDGIDVLSPSVRDALFGACPRLRLVSARAAYLDGHVVLDRREVRRLFKSDSTGLGEGVSLGVSEFTDPRSCSCPDPGTFFPSPSLPSSSIQASWPTMS